MLRIAAFFAFLAAASSPAVAQPPPLDDPSRSDNWRDRRDRYDRYDAWERHERSPQQWQPLADYANARDGARHIRMPPYVELSRIRIEGTHGVPVITRVDVYYRHYVQPVQVNRRLLRGQNVDIDIDQRRDVRTIVIHTDPRYRGGYAVWGG